MTEPLYKHGSLVRDNLMTRAGYSPYCGNTRCPKCMPRAHFNSAISQFECECGWVSHFDEAFIQEYKAKWGIK